MIFEGEITEPEYIENFFRSINPINKTAAPGEMIKGAGVPVTIVEKCIALKEKVEREAQRAGYPNLDEVWAVFDVDDHDVISALQAARNGGIKCVISNPCFEVWGFLHQGTYDRPGHRHDLQRLLREVIPGYHHEKNPRFNWAWCRDKILCAVNNAVIGRKSRDDEGSFFPNDVPSTNFDKILGIFDKTIFKESDKYPSHLD